MDFTLAQVCPRLPLDPIPAPREMVRRLMVATALMIDLEIEDSLEYFHPYLRNCLLSPKSGIAIAGTSCKRPLLLRELSAVCESVGRHGLVVRLGHSERIASTTFDIKLANSTRMMTGYQLWMRPILGSTYFIPGFGKGPYVRLDPRGFNVEMAAPYADDIERASGLKHAWECLSVAVQGWF